jgi:hypothetical protein
MTINTQHSEKSVQEVVAYAFPLTIMYPSFRLGCTRGTDHAASATGVFNNHRLAELLRKRRRNHARDNINRSAGRQWDDQSDRPQRPRHLLGFSGCK